MAQTLKYILWAALAVVNLIAYILMGVDKHRARTGKRRIPEKTLFLFALLFGGLGGTLGMFAFRHKTKHWYFAIFFPLLAVLQIAAVGYLLFA
ncbi:MAG: DUF1294 domain-containing protein [Oscillospiraceae bacterium]|nr:DUF1294 domain-containing protein [Oscillospiraceae bacterium]